MHRMSTLLGDKTDKQKPQLCEMMHTRLETLQVCQNSRCFLVFTIKHICCKTVSVCAIVGVILCVGFVEITHK